jgi:hypothetical protein
MKLVGFPHGTDNTERLRTAHCAESARHLEFDFDGANGSFSQIVVKRYVKPLDELQHRILEVP